MKTLAFFAAIAWLPLTGICQGTNPSSIANGGLEAKMVHLYLKFTGSAGLSKTGAAHLPPTGKTTAGFAYAGGAEAGLEQGMGKITLGTIYESCAAYLKFDGINGENKVNFNFLHIPLQYKFYLSKAKTAYLGGGGYTAALLSSKQTGRSFNADSLRQWSFGAVASGGIQLTPRFSIELQYQKGLTDLGKSAGNNIYPTKPGALFLTLGFTILPAGAAVAIPSIMRNVRKSK